MQRLSLIGFGEAARTFARAARWEGPVRVFDIKTSEAATRYAKLIEYRALRLRGCETSSEAVRRARVILSLVTADQASVVGLEAASAIEEGALYLDMNSVAPGTKRMTAAKLDGAGGRYVHVAIMAPLSPQALGRPFLLRSEGRSVGKEGGRQCGSGGAP